MVRCLAAVLCLGKGLEQREAAALSESAWDLETWDGDVWDSEGEESPLIQEARAVKEVAVVVIRRTRPAERGSRAPVARHKPPWQERGHGQKGGGLEEPRRSMACVVQVLRT